MHQWDRRAILKASRSRRSPYDTSIYQNRRDAARPRLAFGGLLWSTLRDGTEYFKHVDEVMANPQAVGRQAAAAARLRRAGIAAGQDEHARVPLQGAEQPRPRTGAPGDVVDATYTGIVPDTFKDEAEVVLQGQLTPTGFHTEPNGVVAKCPSKYEARKAAALSGS